MGKYCCFTGHRPQNLPWRFNENDERCQKIKEELRIATVNAILDGYTDFYCGMAIGIDMFAAEIVIKLKEELYPYIKLHAAMPCYGQQERWNASLQSRYNDLLKKCDSKTVISPVYTPSCMLTRNRFMVDSCDRLIAVYNNSGGGTSYTINYARKNKKEIVIIPV